MHHVHHHLIVAWARGAKIEYWNTIRKEWASTGCSPTWEPQMAYRIKPEPEPDVVGYCCLDIGYGDKITVRSNFFSTNAEGCDNLMVVFDGETGKLKDAQVLVNSDLAV